MRTGRDVNDEPGKGARPPKFRLGGFFLLFLIFMIFIINFFYSKSFAVEEVSWKDFEDAVAEKRIEKIIVVNKETAEIFLEKEQQLTDQTISPTREPVSGPDYIINIGSVETFEEKLERWQADLSDEEKIYPNYVTRGGFLDGFGWILTIFLIIIGWLFLSRMMRSSGDMSSIFNFGKSTAQVFDKNKLSNINFNDVAGLEEAKADVKEIVDFLKNPQNYTKLGAKIPKGVLLVGPPGTGKTLLARAVAGEAKVPFFSISGSEFVEMFVGVGASRVRDLFRNAKQNSPCIIFIDEIDAIGRSRGKNQSLGSNDERESTLNQLLSEMDGFGANTGIIVLAATNRGEILDKALLRPGRFDRHIYIDLPDVKERKEIFQVHIKKLVVDDSVDIDFLASQTPGFSGAEIANVCNEAALIAARSKKQKVDKEDFMNALDRIIAGAEKKNKIVSAREKEIVAYHEAGHAIAGWVLKGADQLVKITIIPRGRSLGAAWYLPEEHQILSYKQFYNDLCVKLAGRAAEEVVLGEISSGALDDLEKATKEAYTMVAYYGLNKKVGNISYYDSTGGQENVFQKPYSEETARLIDEEVRILIDSAYEKTKKVLIEKKDKLIKVGKLLLEKELIFREDVEKIFGEEQVEEGVKTAR
ncbi:MAG TPA: ATP-dependent zinc metalloprotease FtsH [Cytophagaceae bacterium]